MSSNQTIDPLGLAIAFLAVAVLAGWCASLAALIQMPIPTYPEWWYFLLAGPVMTGLWYAVLAVLHWLGKV